MGKITRITNHVAPIRADGKAATAADNRDVAKALRSIGKHAAAAHYDSIAAAMEKNGKS